MVAVAIVLESTSQHCPLLTLYQHVTYCLGEEGLAGDLTNPWISALPTTIFTCSLSILPACLVPQVVTKPLGTVT